jgi:type I restriction enzyme S subunit
MALDNLDKKSVDLKYLYFTLKKRGLHDAISGTAQPQITRQNLEKILIPLPPFPVQKQIAAILEKADAAMEKRRLVNQLTEQFLQSTFLEMFGDPVTNPKGWKVISFPEIIEYGPQNGLYRPSKDYGEGIPILRIDSFHYGEVHDITDLKRVRIDKNTMNLYLLKESDIVINRVNSTKFLGKSAIIPMLPEPTVFESNMMRITLNQRLAHPKFIVEMLQKNVVRNQILHSAKDAVNQSSINQEDVKSFKFPLPPIGEQKKYAALVEKVESLRSKQKELEKELENLFQSLMQRAFKGELVFSDNNISNV